MEKWPIEVTEEEVLREIQKQFRLGKLVEFKGQYYYTMMMTNEDEELNIEAVRVVETYTSFSAKKLKALVRRDLRDKKYDCYHRSIGRDPHSLTNKWEKETRCGLSEMTPEEDQEETEILRRAMRGELKEDE